MAGKFTFLLAQREAQAYRSQGLHREAVELYTGLLSTNVNMDPELRDTAEREIHEIETEMMDFASQREKSFTAQDVVRMGHDWDERSCETYLLLCADALCSVGSYADALEELKKLLRNGGYRKKYLDPLIDCLTGLYPPRRFPAAVNALLNECLPNGNGSLSLQLDLGKELARRSNRQWAIALYHHLLAKGNLSRSIMRHVTACLAALGQAHDSVSGSRSSQDPM